MTKVVGIDGGKSKTDPCMFCGGDHPSLTCLRVKDLELDEDGSIIRVRFFPPEVWQKTRA